MVYGGSIPTGQGRERAGRHFLKEHSLKIECFSFLFLQVFKKDYELRGQPIGRSALLRNAWFYLFL